MHTITLLTVLFDLYAKHTKLCRTYIKQGKERKARAQFHIACVYNDLYKQAYKRKHGIDLLRIQI